MLDQSVGDDDHTAGQFVEVVVLCEALEDRDGVIERPSQAWPTGSAWIAG